MAAVKIYQGGAVGLVASTGYATPLLVATSGILFIGVAEETVDNSTGSAGGKWIRIRRKGLAGFNNSGLTVADMQASVYFVSGTDDHTVATSPVTILAGTLVAFDSNGVAWVDISAATNPAVVLASAITGTSITGTDSSLGIIGLASASGGAVAIQGGTSSGASTAGGAVTITGGTPGASGVGGAVTVAGGIGGASTGAGGEVIVAGGAGTADNMNGGALTLRGGNAHGSGTDGAIAIGATNTSSITFGVMPRIPVVDKTATGSTQAHALAAPTAVLAEGANVVGSADGTKGVAMPAAVAGAQVIIKNTANAVLKVWPNTDDAINALSANANFVLAAYTSAYMVAIDATTWVSIPLLAS
jgi:hypothetical protein